MVTVLGKAGDEAANTLETFGFELGLAFQITDDLLDVEGDEDDEDPEQSFEVTFEGGTTDEPDLGVVSLTLASYSTLRRAPRDAWHLVHVHGDSSDDDE